MVSYTSTQHENHHTMLPAIARPSLIPAEEAVASTSLFGTPQHLLYISNRRQPDWLPEARRGRRYLLASSSALLSSDYPDICCRSGALKTGQSARRIFPYGLVLPSHSFGERSEITWTSAASNVLAEGLLCIRGCCIARTFSRWTDAETSCCLSHGVLKAHFLV